MVSDSSDHIATQCQKSDCLQIRFYISMPTNYDGNIELRWQGCPTNRNTIIVGRVAMLIKEINSNEHHLISFLYIYIGKEIRQLMLKIF